MSFFSSFSSFSSIFSQQISTIDPLSFAMYWEETALVVSARVQGLGSENVSLEVRGSKLVLIVHDGVRRRCIQSCQLPENVNVGQSMTEINENGVLTVRVPREKEPEPPKNKRHAHVIHAAHSRRGCFFC